MPDSPLLTPATINAAKAHLSREVRGALTDDELTFYVSASVRSFLAAQDRDALASVIAQAWAGERYIGDLPATDILRAYRVVDALLGTADVGSR